MTKKRPRASYAEAILKDPKLFSIIRELIQEASNGGYPCSSICYVLTKQWNQCFPTSSKDNKPTIDSNALHFFSKVDNFFKDLGEFFIREFLFEEKGNIISDIAYRVKDTPYGQTLVDSWKVFTKSAYIALTINGRISVDSIKSAKRSICEYYKINP